MFIFCGTRHRHLADFPVAIFTIQLRRHVRTMAEVDEVGQDGDRHPGNRLILLDVIGQFVDFGISDGDLLVTTPAFVFGRQPGRRSAQAPRDGRTGIECPP